MFASLNSFIGRQSEIDSLRALLNSGVRLITLTGPGGIGKTRLALETLKQTAIDFEDNVFFIPLDALAEAGQVFSKIANILEVGESGNRPVVDDLSVALAEKHSLLCVDNWEHVLDAAPLLTNLLANCPHLYILATSREALRISGEQVFPIHPLGLTDGEQALKSSAVQLFADRARSTNPDFQLNEINTPVIVSICAVLDGLPLAIELAAALLRMFSPQALLSRLSASPGLESHSAAIHLLSGGPRDLPVRQKTLYATIEWSYNLLTIHEQLLFRWLAVFSGGCDLAAVQFVCGDEKIDSLPISDILLSLEDKNLLFVVQTNDEPRFFLLRTIQEYALEQLDVSGELSLANQRYAAYYLDLVKRAAPGLIGPQRGNWLARLDQENDNLRAVLSWFLEKDEIESSYLLGGGLWRFWYLRGQIKEGSEWLSRILSKEGKVSDVLRADALNGAGGLALFRNDYDVAKNQLKECLALRKKIGDKLGMAATHHNLGQLAIHQNEYKTALFHIRQSLQLDGDSGDQSGVASDLFSIGWILSRQKEFKAAQEHIKRGLAISTNLGDQWQIALSQGLLGEIAYGQGSYEKSQQYLEAAKTMFTEIGDLGQLSGIDCALGLTQIHKGNLQQAESLFHSSLKHRYSALDQMGVAQVLEGLAYLASSRYLLQKAARLWGAAETLRASLGTPLTAVEEDDRDLHIKVVRNHLREKAFMAEKEIGAAMSLDQVVQYALEFTEVRDHVSTSKGDSSTLSIDLTPRELDVLRLVAQGLSDAQVAERLVLSPRTINSHLTNIYNKLGVKSRVAASRFAIKHGLA
jgi:non-specific serine/threonine protein kinase